jgi:thiopeptide-type bacteriocin biosynthesis protein
MEIAKEVVFRAPLFPYSSIKNESVILEFTQDKLFRKALYLASPVLYNQLEKLETGQLRDVKEIAKVKISLYKYISRSSTRCTPFGLFAGLGVASWNNANSILLNTEKTRSMRQRTRLDMNIVIILSQYFSRQKHIKPHIKFFLNNSLYKLGNFYRFIEHVYDGQRKIHRLSKIDFSTYVEDVFNLANRGVRVDELLSYLVKKRINIEEAHELVEDLINSQLLTSELEPKITGSDPFDNLISRLSRINEEFPTLFLEKKVEDLGRLRQLVSGLDSLDAPISEYKEVYDNLRKIFPSIAESNILQADLFIDSEKSYINKAIQGSIYDAIKFLNKICPAYPNYNLEEFKSRFRTRYEDSEIPLLQALDVETGIGYPNRDNEGINDLIDDIYLPSNSNRSQTRWDVWQSMLFQLLSNAIKNNKNCIDLAEEDFKGVNFESTKLPHSFPVKFRLIDETSGTIYIEGIGGASATSLLGRFAHGNKDVAGLLTKIVEHEEKQVPGRIVAEIVHLPQNRLGNVTIRPVLRKHEIPYLSPSSVGTEFQIHANDLLVSIRQNRIILRSKKLNKEVLPRLSNAHNFSVNSLPVYHFLGDLQLQYFEKSALTFNWGTASNQFKYLPRVKYKNSILSPARWQLERKDFEPLTKLKVTEEILSAFKAFKLKFKLPDTFLFVEGDNDLFIDTKIEIAVLSFIDVLKGKRQIMLEEFLFSSSSQLIKDNEGKLFTNECIVTVLNYGNSLPNAPIKDSFGSAEHFIPGSEWIFYKVYCGVKMADCVLKDYIFLVATNLRKAEVIDKWFFIRYSDPDNHIRFRLHVSDPRQMVRIIEAVKASLDSLIECGIISKIQIDTYKRETQRYKGRIGLTEALFHLDSISCCRALTCFQKLNGEALRWQYAIMATDKLLEDFKLTAEQKYILLHNLSQSFFKEHGGRKELKLQLDNKFRNLRKTINYILTNRHETNNYALFDEILTERSEHSSLFITEILKDTTGFDEIVMDLLGSYLHMMFNRIFVAKQRTNEFVVYDLLAKYYRSDLARKKNANNIQISQMD